MSTQKAQAYLDKQVIDLSYGAREGLSKAVVGALLQGGVAWDNYIQEAYNNSFFYIDEQLQYLRDDVARRFDADKECLNVDNVDITLGTEYLIELTRAYIGVPIGVRREHYPPTYEPTYEDQADELEALGINPCDLYKDWPDLPERADPVFEADDMLELLINDFYGGEYVALLDAEPVLKAAYRDDLDDYTILKAGALVTIYDFFNGAGSMLVPTRRDIVIDPSEIYHDGAHFRSIQTCYGLTYGSWNGQLAKPQEV